MLKHFYYSFKQAQLNSILNQFLAEKQLPGPPITHALFQGKLYTNWYDSQIEQKEDVIYLGSGKLSEIRLLKTTW